MDPSNSFSGLHIELHPSSLYSHHQQQHPSQNLNPDEMKLKKITQLQVAFDHSKTTDEMLKTFQAMELEPAFDEYELGLASLKVAMMLENVGEDPEKTLSFAVRAWNALDKDDKAIFPAAMALKLLGSITYNLKRFDCSLDFLNMANSVFSRMEKDGFSEIPITAMIDEVQYLLANVKMAMGRREDALENLRNCLEIKYMNMKTCDRQVAVANHDLAAAYAEVLNYKEALPFCLKALKIHDNQLGHNAIEVLRDRQLLGIIYSGLGEHQKALEQNELVQKVLNNTGLSSGFLGEEIDRADAQIALGKSSSNPTNARELKTPVEILSQMSSRSHIQEAFESAKSTEEMLKVFQDMESTFDEYELGRASLRVSLMLDKEGNDPEKILSFAYRAFNTFNRYDGATLQSVIALQLMGSATYSLNQLNDSLWYLNRAKIVLAKLEEEGMGRVFTRSVLHKVQRGLANVNRAMGRGEEALGNLTKCLDIEEINFEDTSKAFGDANYALALAYVDLLNHREALSFCLQALEIHKKKVGNNSEVVKLDRKLLIRIYTELLEYQKALKQNLLLQKVLKNLGLTSDLIRAEIDAADLQIWSGKYNEALDTLKPVVQKTDKESETQAQVFVTMANALYNKRKFADAKRCLKTASGILMNEKIEKTSKVGQVYIKMGMLYETMTEFETAISVYHRGIAIIEKYPEGHHGVAHASARLGKLLLSTGKASQAISYLESAAGRMKECPGPKDIGLGYVYMFLGVAYMKLDRFQSAAQMFALAKDIMDVSLGPHHSDSVEACQSLSKAYCAMGSYNLAIKYQQQVINAHKGHGPNAKNELTEAHRLLKQLLKRASGAS